MLYVLVADNEIDQICETREQARKEKRDLEEMGCTVRIKKFATWDEANAYETKMRGY